MIFMWSTQCDGNEFSLFQRGFCYLFTPPPGGGKANVFSIVTHIEWEVNSTCPPDSKAALVMPVNSFIPTV